LAGAVARAILAAARALPTELLRVVEYSLQFCCVLALTAVIWLTVRRARSAPGHGTVS